MLSIRVYDAKIISVCRDRTSLYALTDRLYRILLSTVSVETQVNEYIRKHYQGVRNYCGNMITHQVTVNRIHTTSVKRK